jgi:hypothetical protein
MQAYLAGLLAEVHTLCPQARPQSGYVTDTHRCGTVVHDQQPCTSGADAVSSEEHVNTAVV